MQIGNFRGQNSHQRRRVIRCLIGASNLFVATVARRWIGRESPERIHRLATVATFFHGLCAIGVSNLSVCFLLSYCFAGQIAADETAEGAKSANRMSHSAPIVVPREVSLNLAKAHEYIRRGKLGLAVLELSKLARTDPTQMVLTSRDSRIEQFEAVHVVVSRILNGLPASARRLYELQMGERAARQLQDAIDEKSLSGLVGVAQRFPTTDAGRLALKHLVARHLDRGRWRSAIGAIRRLEADPHINAPARKLLSRQLVFCLERLQGLEHPTIIPSTTDAIAAARTEAEGKQQDISLLAHVIPQVDSRLWTVNYNNSPQWKATVLPAVHEHAEQSIPVLPRARPLVHGGKLLVRSSTEIMALDLQSGVQSWQHDAASSTQFGAERAPFVPSLRGLLAKSLAREIQLDSIHSQIISIGDLICYVQASPQGLTKPPRPSKLMPFAGRLPIAASNQIIARDVSSGKLAWEITGRTLSSADTELSAYFLGVPTVVGDQLFGVVQINEDVFLYVLNDQGQLQWKCRLASTARNSPADLDWRSFSCPVLVTDGVAVCPTNAGLLGCVELFSRSLRWSYRYQRDDATQSIDLQQTNRPNREWWNGWRETRLIPFQIPSQPKRSSATRCVLFAGPDQHGLVALDLNSGRQLWSHAVDSPVELLGTSHDSAFVSCRHTTQAIDVLNGKTHWKITSPEPIGQGILTRQMEPKERWTYAYPATGQRIVLIDLTSGKLLNTADGFESPMNLSLVQGQIVAQGLDHISAWPSVGRWLARAERARVDQGIGYQMRIARSYSSLGIHEQANAIYEATTQSLLTSGDKSTKEERRKLVAEIAIERFRQTDQWRQTEPSSITSEQLHSAKELIETYSSYISVRQTIDAWISLARAAARHREFKMGMDAYLAALRLNPEGHEFVYSGGPVRRVLIERLIQGELVSLIERADPKERAKLREHFWETVVDQVTKNQDPFAKQRAAQRVRTIAWARPLQFLAETEIGVPFYQQQLELLTIERISRFADGLETKASKLSARTRARERLAQLFLSRSYDKDAAFWHWKLSQSADDGSKSVQPSRKNASDSGSLPGRERLLKTLGKSEWSVEPPTVDTSGQTAINQMQLVEIHSQRGSPFSRLSAFVSKPQRSGQTLVLCGDGHPGQWSLRLPHSETPFRQIVRPQAWGIGQFLVLRLGSEIFGITPFAPNGQPRPRLIWTQDMDATAVIGGIRVDAKIPGVRTAEVEFLDPLGRPVGQVGPVLPGYLCYRSKGKLCCLETATGKLLWERYELPRRANLSGDSERIFIVTNGESRGESDHERRVSVLRVSDGSTAREFSIRLKASSVTPVLWCHDSLLHVVCRAASGCAWQTFSLDSGKLLWDREFEPADQVFLIDEDTVGLASLQHGLILLDASTGQERLRREVKWPKKLAHVFAICDDSQIYVVYSRSPPDGIIRPPQIWANRNEFIDGGIIAINRWSLKQHWHRKLKNEQINWAQPGGVPFLVLSYRAQVQDKETEKRPTIFHLIDKRTGKTIHRESKPVSDERYLIEPNAPQNWIRLQTTNRSIRLNYPAL
jgi:outer membrane protein assembly factor BamB